VLYSQPPWRVTQSTTCNCRSAGRGYALSLRKPLTRFKVMCIFPSETITHHFPFHHALPAASDCEMETYSTNLTTETGSLLRCCTYRVTQELGFFFKPNGLTVLSEFHLSCVEHNHVSVTGQHN
jgi:hypothetical protein